VAIVPIGSLEASESSVLPIERIEIYIKAHIRHAVGAARSRMAWMRAYAFWRLGLVSSCLSYQILMIWFFRTLYAMLSVSSGRDSIFFLDEIGA
jgi:hypothetical protein